MAKTRLAVGVLACSALLFGCVAASVTVQDEVSTLKQTGETQSPTIVPTEMNRAVPTEMNRTVPTEMDRTVPTEMNRLVSAEMLNPLPSMGPETAKTEVPPPTPTSARLEAVPTPSLTRVPRYAMPTDQEETEPERTYRVKNRGNLFIQTKKGGQVAILSRQRNGRSSAAAAASSGSSAAAAASGRRSSAASSSRFAVAAAARRQAEEVGRKMNLSQAERRQLEDVIYRRAAAAAAVRRQTQEPVPPKALTRAEKHQLEDMIYGSTVVATSSSAASISQTAIAAAARQQAEDIARKMNLSRGEKRQLEDIIYRRAAAAASEESTEPANNPLVMMAEAERLTKQLTEENDLPKDTLSLHQMKDVLLARFVAASRIGSESAPKAKNKAAKIAREKNLSQEEQRKLEDSIFAELLADAGIGVATPLVSKSELAVANAARQQWEQNESKLDPNMSRKRQLDGIFYNARAAEAESERRNAALTAVLNAVTNPAAFFSGLTKSEKTEKATTEKPTIETTEKPVDETPPARRRASRRNEALLSSYFRENKPTVDPNSAAILTPYFTEEKPTGDPNTGAILPPFFTEKKQSEESLREEFDRWQAQGAIRTRQRDSAAARKQLLKELADRRQLAAEAGARQYILEHPIARSAAAAAAGRFGAAAAAASRRQYGYSN